MYVHWSMSVYLEVNTQKHAVKSKKWICLSGMCSLDLHGLMGGGSVCVWCMPLPQITQQEKMELLQWMTNARQNNSAYDHVDLL